MTIFWKKMKSSLCYCHLLNQLSLGAILCKLQLQSIMIQLTVSIAMYFVEGYMQYDVWLHNNAMHIYISPSHIQLWKWAGSKMSTVSVNKHH